MNAATTGVNGGTGDVIFQNDPFPPDSNASSNNFCSPYTGNPAPCGYVFLNTNYRTWTANTAAGSTPDARLVAGVMSHTGSDLTLTVPYAFKLQEGMAVYDLTAGTALGVVDQTPTLNNHVHISATPGGINTHQLQFTGCGYPGLIDTGSARKPWLGNCAATAYLFYGTSADYGASGIGCDIIRSHGWRVYFHMNNGQETVCNKVIFDSGSHGTGVDNGVTADPTSIGVWVENDGDKIELADGKIEARTGFLNTGTLENAGVALANFNITTSSDYSVVFANSGRSHLAQLHGAADGVGYADSSELALTLTANDLGDTTIYYDNPNSPYVAAIHCSNNVFASTFCGNLLNHTAAGGLLPSVSGSSTVSGNDSAGRISVGGTPSTITITFAQPWASTPVCFAEDETNSAKNPVSVSNPSSTSITLKAFGASSSFANSDKVSYQCTGFK